jgi:hypothetical protein
LIPAEEVANECYKTISVASDNANGFVAFLTLKNNPITFNYKLIAL